MEIPQIKKNDDGSTEIKAHGHTVKMNPDGSFENVTPNGAVIKMDGKGQVSMDNLKVERVAIEDLSLVEAVAHESLSNGAFRKTIRFVGGGQFVALFGADGKFQSGQGKKLVQSYSVDGVLTLQSSSPDKAA